MLEHLKKTIAGVPDKEFKEKKRLEAKPKPKMSGQPERSTQPPPPPPFFYPMHRVVPGREK
eukprot:1131400-Karenia_brevis.AAC.1